MAGDYGVTIIMAHFRTPKDKSDAEGTIKNISTWITVALWDKQFFSLAELNCAIRDMLEPFNKKLFQKKDGSRRSLFLEEEKTLLHNYPLFVLNWAIEK